MGSCNRSQTRRPILLELQNLPVNSSRKGSITQMARRGTQEGIHHPVKIPLRLALLLYQKEGRQTSARAGLSEVE